jgi:hypothetical protein
MGTVLAGQQLEEHLDSLPGEVDCLQAAARRGIVPEPPRVSFDDCHNPTW